MANIDICERRQSRFDILKAITIVVSMWVALVGATYLAAIV